MRRAPIALLCTAAIAILLAVPAQAVPIHKHLTVHREKRIPDSGEVAVVTRHVVRVKDVAPEPTPTAASTPYVAPAPTTTSVPAAPVASSGGYSIPSYIVQCESGGNYSAVNPSSGAYGAYQILPSTAANYGCDVSTPAGQDSCAASIYADVGSSAWSCG
jgi:hypothetical protein